MNRGAPSSLDFKLYERFDLRPKALSQSKTPPSGSKIWTNSDLKISGTPSVQGSILRVQALRVVRFFRPGRRISPKPQRCVRVLIQKSEAPICPTSPSEFKVCTQNPKPRLTWSSANAKEGSASEIWGAPSIQGSTLGVQGL